MNKIHNINQCLTCILGENSILWHYNEIPNKLRFKERLLIRYIGGFKTLIYEFGYCKLIQEVSTFKYAFKNAKKEEIDEYINQLNDLDKFYMVLENKEHMEISIRNIHSWCYTIDLLALIDDGK